MKRAVLVLLLLSASSAARADSWEPPSRQSFESPDGAARLTVVPRPLESSLAYFEDKVAGIEPAGSPQGSKANSATAILEVKDAGGRWTSVWTKPLINGVAPVDVVLADKAEGFATFDNWHSMGHGPNAVVIYDGHGNVVRALALTDLFPNWFVAALPHSVSSIHWRGDVRVSRDGMCLIVPVVQPSTAHHFLPERKEIDLAIRLADGVAVGLDQQQWQEALAAAAAVASEICAVQRQAIREWNAPIFRPETGDEQDWHQYLRETQYRTKWPDDPQGPSTTVLRQPGHSDFRASLEWLEEVLTESAVVEGDLRAIGSPDADRLSAEIERIARGLKPGQLKEVELAIVADTVHGSRIRQALASSGAKLTIIDPAQSFPQPEQRTQDEAELIVCQAL